MDHNPQTERVNTRLRQLYAQHPGSISDILHLELVKHEPETQTYWFRGKTEYWMRNGAGTLHGGLGATLLDHGMGALFFCLKQGDTVPPTIEMQASYHRPICPGKDILIKARPVSITRRLAHMAAEVYQADAPDKICLSGTAVYFVVD